MQQASHMGKLARSGKKSLACWLARPSPYYTSGKSKPLGPFTVTQPSLPSFLASSNLQNLDNTMLGSLKPTKMKRSDLRWLHPLPFPILGEITRLDYEL